MLMIQNNKFSEKFTEINIRQRLYKENSFITLMINNEFYPSLVGDRLVSGAIEIKLDIEGINSIDSLVGKDYSGDIGSITISVNNDGVWEHQSYDKFDIKFLSRKGRHIEFELKTDDCILNTTATLVSLYTTSSTEKQLNESFDLSDFYDRPVKKAIGNNEVIKYFVKE